MFAYIGSFTTPKRNGHGKGISVYRIDQDTGAWKLIEEFVTIPNPGYLALDSQQRFIYASHGDSGDVSAYAVDKASGRLKSLNQQASGGDNAPHLCIDPTGRCVLVANGPGIAVLPINADGSLAPCSDMVVPPGEPGPYRRDQDHGAHPHQILFDPGGRFLVAPDKGVDRVHVYRLDTATGKLVPNDPLFVKARRGAGPRHIIFHPARPLAYLVNELGSNITTYQWDAARGALKPLQVIPTTPDTYTGDNTGAEIAVAPSGRFVCVSNRGHDSVGVFSVDAGSGMLAPVCWESTQGRKPRFFTFDPAGNLLYVANEITDTIVAFRLDQQTGKLTPTGQIIATGTPSCIVFANG